MLQDFQDFPSFFFFWTQKAINSPVILGFSVCACMWFVGGINACVWVFGGQECGCSSVDVLVHRLTTSLEKVVKNVNALGRISPVLSV